MARDREPIAEALGDDEDLYDVATWSPRTLTDHVAVRLDAGLRSNGERLLVALAALLLVAQLAIGGFVFFRAPALSLLTVVSVVPALALAAAIWYLDPTGHAPVGLLAVTFVLGVLFAGFAAVVDTFLFQVFRLIPVVGFLLLFFLAVGPIEETVKWLAVRVHAFRRPAFSSVVDGMVYGAVAGLGFATVENTIYITHQFLIAAGTGGTGGPVRAAVSVAAARAFVGPGHVLYAAISGYYLGLAKFNPDRAGPIVVKGLLLAALAHATYDTIVTYSGVSGLTFVVFIALFDGAVLWYLARKLRRYRRRYAEAMAVAAAPPRPDLERR